MATIEYGFDVFLSHNSHDKPAVRELAAALQQRGLKVWLDEQDLPPGQLYQPLLEKGIRESASVAVFIGKDGQSPWEDIEKQAAMALAVQDKRPLIPVLLPDAPADPSASLNLFLTLYTWVDLRPAVTENKLDRLQWGITGKKPNRKAPLTLPSPEGRGFSRKIHSDQLPTVAGEFFGRKEELQLLDDAFTGDDIRIVQFIAPGGTGKTKLLRQWLDRRAPDIEALIAWSFYSQGSSEDKQVSATPFFSHAFAKLGSDQTQFPTEEAKGEHLADLLKAHRCLLVLDGLEPMQHAGRGMRGELKDRAIRALLRNLLGGEKTLCVITTRLALPELQSRAHVASRDLQNLASADGVALLRSLGVHGGAKELQKAVQDYGCHALALHLLGNALRIFHDGELSQRDCLPELIEPGQYDNLDRASLHAFKVMQAYQDWFKDEQGRDLPELRLLYLLGLFDHPIETPVLQLLWREPIAGLTVWEESVVPAGIAGTQAPGMARPSNIPVTWIPAFPAGMTSNEAMIERHWQTAIAALRDNHHLLARHEAKPSLLDCHPLIREYFGRRLRRDNPDAWRQAHAKLYDYYQLLSKEELPGTLEEMQPLFNAVAHGCAAGMHQRALDEVYWPRIKRKGEHYLTAKLGAFSDDLATVAHFFDPPWRTPAACLSELWQASALNWAGFRLRALGRLREAVEPMQAAVENVIKQENWVSAASGASTLSELQLTLGEIPAAIASTRRSVEYADKTEDKFQRMTNRATLADALHQAADTAAAQTLLEEAERLQQERQPQYAHLYSLAGFRYCDLLLAQGETAAVLERAEEMLNQGAQDSLLDIALYKLSLGRAYLQQSIVPVGAGHARDQPPNRGHGPLLQQAEHWLNLAMAGLRAAGYQEYLALGLLAHAAYCRHTQAFEQAQKDLQEVFDLAEPSGMLLHLTDAHLEAARLALAEALALALSAGEGELSRSGFATPTVTFENRAEFQNANGGVANPATPQREFCEPAVAATARLPQADDFRQTARHHTEAAAKLIAQTGYKRRLPELSALQQNLGL